MSKDVEVSIENIKAILEAAFIGCKIDEDGDLYASEGIDFPVFIGVDNDRPFIKFFSYASFKDGETVDEAKANAFCNNINRKFYLITTYQHTGRVWFNYYMRHGGMVEPKILVDVLRRCGNTFRQAVKESDVDDLVD